MSSSKDQVPGELDYRMPLPANAPRKDKEKFAQHYTQYFRDNRWDAGSVWDMFAELFGNFTKESFTSLPVDIKTALRNTLRDAGLQIRIARGVHIGDALYEALENGYPEAYDDAASQQLKQELQPESESEKGANKPSNSRGPEPQQPPFANATPFLRDPKAIASIAKLYGTKDKYGGEINESFDNMLIIFKLDCADHAIIDEADIVVAMRHMLKDQALQYYISHCQGRDLSLDVVETLIRKRFQTEERTAALWREWDAISLKSLIAKNPEKPVREVFRTMVKRFQYLQHCFADKYHDDEALRMRLINATLGVPACASARNNPAKTVTAFITGLEASISQWESERIGAETLYANRADTLHADFDEALYIDRRYSGNNPSNRRYNNVSNNRREAEGRNHRYNQPYGQYRNIPRNPRPSLQGASQRAGPGLRNLPCFVCFRPGCHSRNHAPAERYKNARQYMADFEEEMNEAAEEMACMNNDGNQEKALPLLPDEEENDDSKIVDPADPANALFNSAFLARTDDSATFHAVTKTIKPIRYSEETFYGILVDTGANNLSTAGKAQFEAYCAASGTRPCLQASSASCKFGVGMAKAIDAVAIPFPVGSMIMKADFHLIDADLPFLLCLKDMDRLGVKYDNTEDLLIHAVSGNAAPVRRTFGHPFVYWDPVAQSLFTEAELRRLHRRFGHPSAGKLYALLRRAECEADHETHKALEAISRECEPCQRNAQAPRRFKFALHDEKEFNGTIYVDVLYIDSRPVLHVVDEATNFQAARWLPNVAADIIWQALRLCWIDVYVGPPDVIAHDAGKGFTAGQFQASADMLHITTKGIPVESPQSMSPVERYHAPLRRAYNIIASESPANTDPALILQAAVKACNDSVGPDGLIPNLLVFGTIPRLGLPNDLPAPATYKRAAAVRKATEELTRAAAKMGAG